jgi:hypothetical protein
MRSGLQNAAILPLFAVPHRVCRSVVDSSPRRDAAFIGVKVWLH